MEVLQVVEQIRAKRRKPEGAEYLVRYKGGDFTKDCWIAASELEEYKKLIDKFEEENPRKSRQRNVIIHSRPKVGHQRKNLKKRKKSVRTSKRSAKVQKVGTK
jgi:hypothetical protein